MHKLQSLNLSRKQFGDVKNLLALGERLKVLEQQLNFLKRCKKNTIFPQVIENSIRIKDLKSLFPISTPKNLLNHIRNLKTQSLRQIISFKYILICRNKKDINQCKQCVRNSVDSSSYSSIIDLFISSGYEIKQKEKVRLMKKFDWLVNQRYEPPVSSSARPNSCSTVHGFTDETPKDCIMTIQVEVTEQEQSLLALGPNFALSPKAILAVFTSL